MAGLGGSSLAKDKQAIGMFLSNKPIKSDRDDNNTEKCTIQKGVKLSKRQNTDLEDLKAALGTNLDAEAIRWALDKVFELMGDEIREVAKKKREFTLS